MTIAVVCTMDTKGSEAKYLRDRIGSLGHQTTLIDVSLWGKPNASADVSGEAIPARSGRSWPELLADKERSNIVAAVAESVALILVDLFREDRIHGVIGIGGNQGTAIAATAMRALPIGFPKFLVSTVASGNIRPFVGHKDIAAMFSVSDFVGGINMVSRTILANVAGAVVGMAEHGSRVCAESDRTTVAITALGNTEHAANKIGKLLRADGYEVVTFHASGAGGSAMEELIRAGMIDAVLDLTLHELTEEVLGVGAYAPVVPGRFTAASEQGIPVVAAPGGMEYLCFGPRSSVPKDMRDRVICMHNPYNANVMINHEELLEVADVLAERINTSGPETVLLVPRIAWSRYGEPGGPFHDAEGIAKFVERLEERIAPHVSFSVMENGINDDEFIDVCVRELKRLLKQCASASM